jgi:hypothetical protein
MHDISQNLTVTHLVVKFPFLREKKVHKTEPTNNILHNVQTTKQTKSKQNVYLIYMNLKSKDK